MFISDNINVANITTTLTVITSGLDNGTNITCVTYKGVTKSQSFSILYILCRWLAITIIDSLWESYFADVTHWIKASITHQEKDTYFTAVLYRTGRYVWWRRSSNWSLHSLFKWTTAHGWRLQAPLTVLTSCTILHCQWTSQPITVQDIVIPFHLRYSIIKVESFCETWF